MGQNWWDQGPPPPAIPPIRPPVLGGQAPQRGGGQSPSMMPGMQDPMATLAASNQGQRSPGLGQLPPPKVPPMPQTGGMQQSQQGQNYASQMIAGDLVSQALNQKFFPQQQGTMTGAAPAATAPPATAQPGAQTAQQQAATAHLNPSTSSTTKGPTDRTSLQSYAKQSASKYGYPPDLLDRQIMQESGYDPNARGKAGEIGVGQFEPGTAAGLGIDPSDPYASIDGMAKYMADLTRQYGDIKTALIAYNGGQGEVDYYHQTGQLYGDTAQYIKNIMGQ